MTFIPRSRLVAEAVKAGHTDLNKLQPPFPHLNRDQLQKALGNAKDRGWIVLELRGTGGRNRGLMPGVWAPSTAGVPLVRPLKCRPPASVWELAVDRSGDWPPKGEGRLFVQPDDETEEPAVLA